MGLGNIIRAVMTSCYEIQTSNEILHIFSAFSLFKTENMHKCNKMYYTFTTVAAAQVFILYL